VALKVLLHGAHAIPRQAHRFEREIDLAACLRHPNTVTIFDSGTAVGQPFSAMEFTDGRPLGWDEGAASVRDRLTLFRTVCADVYALGAILDELLTGRLPYDATGSLAEVVRHLTHFQPVSRDHKPDTDDRNVSESATHRGGQTVRERRDERHRQPPRQQPVE
jgi:serine/threonine protein kinase